MAAGPTLSNDAILVLEGFGAPLVAADAEQLAALWRMLDGTHASGLGLRDVSPSKLVVDPAGAVGLSELASAISAPSEDEAAFDGPSCS